MAGGIQFNSLSSRGAFIFRALSQYANDHKPVHPQVYQVDELYILHTASGGAAYVIPPTTAAIGLLDEPPKPLPIDLIVITLREDLPDATEMGVNSQIATVPHVWTINPVWHSLSVKDGAEILRTYQPGDVYTGEPFLTGFSLDISELFGIAPNDPAHLSLEDQSLLRKILYPIIFEANPLNAIDRVIAMLEKKSDDSRDMLPASIQSALASTFKLKTLLPSIAASEEAIRAFLQEVARRLSAD